MEKYKTEFKLKVVESFLAGKAGEKLRAMMATIATQQITDADMDEINAAVKQVRAERRQARGS